MTIKIKSTIFIITAIIAVSIMVFWFGFGVKPWKEKTTERTSAPIYLLDFNNDAAFVGATDNLFVGKVIRQSGTKSIIRNIPSSQFEVNVILNIKGNLQGTISVNQLGGSADSAEEGLLSPNSTYLFATRGEFHTLTFGSYASSLLTSDKSLTNEQLRILVQSNKRVKDLQIAYPNEVSMDADTAHNRTPNSFRSLPFVEQERIKAEVELLKVNK